MAEKTYSILVRGITKKDRNAFKRYAKTSRGSANRELASYIRETASYQLAKEMAAKPKLER